MLRCPTYRDLLEKFKTFTDEELDNNATVYLANTDEYLMVETLDYADAGKQSVLDDGRPIFVIDF